MPEPTVLHRCPHCGRVFDSPSVCLESGDETVPFPAVVPKQQMPGRMADHDDADGGDRA